MILNHNLVATVVYGEKWNDGVQAGLEKRQVGSKKVKEDIII